MDQRTVELIISDKLRPLYERKRATIMPYFVESNRIADSLANFTSPSGKFSLELTNYRSEPGVMSVSRGIVRRISDGVIVADIQRNLVSFWHQWVQHPNGYEYLLCGEDYQGYTIVNLHTATTRTYLPDSTEFGMGFCWAAVYPAPDLRTLAVEGCVWAAPYEIVFYNFADPDHPPLPMLGGFAYNLDKVIGWQCNDTFVATAEVEVRKSDGTPYNQLSDAEQEVLDQDASLVVEVKQTMRWQHPLPKHETLINKQLSLP